MFSKACEYGMRATIYVALQSKEGERPNLIDIAEAINSPSAFKGKFCKCLLKMKSSDLSKDLQWI